MENVLVEHQLEVAASLRFHDLINFAHTGRIARSVADSVVSRRVQAQLDLYFPDTSEDFWCLLDAGSGGIIGSIPLWVTERSPEWSPSDCNIVVAKGHFLPLIAFLEKMGYSKRQQSARPVIVGQVHSRQALDIDVYASFAAYSKVCATGRHLFITITESPASHIFPVLTTVDHTLQALVLTSSSIIVLYPNDVRDRRAVFRAGEHLPLSLVSNYMDRFFDFGVESLVTNAYEEGPCASPCVGSLRRLRGRRHIALFTFKRARNSDLLAQDALSRFVDKSFHGAWVFSLEAIQREIDAVFAAEPAYPAVWSALLFPAGIPSAVPVPLALDHGLSTLQFPEDLRTYTWLKMRAEGSKASDLTGFYSKLNSYVFEVCGDDGIEYWVWFEDLGDTRIINTSLGTTSLKPALIHGDILVARKARRGLTDLTVEDVARVRKTVRTWWVHEGALAAQGLRDEQGKR
ncbi:hypothetical protein R3P38DRAFT_3196020 [Favolaschia claudopus]|uniref:Uncharacterized protein n=1 Tax=Favolaschia claudopus TaxID=2862362 RepID=A0AAW0B9V5_9AGAR